MKPEPPDGDVPIEVIVEVDERGRRLEPPQSAGRGPSLRWVVVAAAVLLAVASIAWLLDGDEGDRAQPDETPTTTGTAVDEAPGPATNDEGVFTVAAAVGADGSVTITARSDAPTVPWVTFELCAVAPPGCVPVWTHELAKEGTTFTAELRLRDTFVSPGGFRHDCRTEDCVLRVATRDHSVAFAVVEGEPVLADAPPTPTPVPTTTLGDPGPASAVVEPTATGVRVAVTDVPDGVRVVVRACPAVALQCPVLARGPAAGGDLTVDVPLPALMAARVVGPDGEIGWTETDCREVVGACVVVVDLDGVAGLRLPLPTDLAPPPTPTLRADAEAPVAPGDFVTVEGSGFVSYSTLRAGRAQWLLCERRPTAFAEIPASCGTPRIVRPPSVDDAGEVAITVPAPDPTKTRTWVHDEPLACREQCWLVVLAEPFPRIAAAPIGYGSR